MKLFHFFTFELFESSFLVQFQQMDVDPKRTFEQFFGNFGSFDGGSKIGFEKTKSCGHLFRREIRVDQKRNESNMNHIGIALNQVKFLIFKNFTNYAKSYC